MIVSRTIADVRAALAERRDGRVGLVPTMGALHGGHEALLGAARRECDTVVMSLFVNPAQFRPGEDLERYPRDEEGDAALADAEGVDLIYAPVAEQVYPPGFSTHVEVEGLTDVLCGDPQAGCDEYGDADGRDDWAHEGLRLGERGIVMTDRVSCRTTRSS